MVRVHRPQGCFLDECCEYLGFVQGAQRWRSMDRQMLYTWDDLHGEIEVFNLRGRHIEVLDAYGLPNGKEAVRGRKIDV